MKLISIICLILINQNSFGQFVGTPYIFNSISDLPQVTTNTVTAIFSTKATSGGQIVSAGSSSITSRGVVWSTSQHPTIIDSKTTNGSGTSNFLSNLSGLNKESTYYVRAYATNSFGTAYGEEFSFTTPSLSIGDYYQGGYIFYILSPSESIDKGGGSLFQEISYQEGEIHGLIVAAEDPSTNPSVTKRAGNNGVFTRYNGIGYGKLNTKNLIDLGVLDGSASQFADDFSITVGGATYSDWYLPSLNEIKIIRTNQALINFSNLFTTQIIYWTSTSESSTQNPTNARYFEMNTARDRPDNRNNRHYYLIIRSF